MVGVTTTNANSTSHQQYIYDASGDRVASIADGVRTNYLVDPMRGVSQVLLEYDANGQVTAEYTYGLGLIKSDRSGNENYYHTDGLGSTRVLTNSLGQVVDNYTYDAYGRLLSSTGTSSNSYQFAGEQRDSQTGLDYLRARYYDADLGRFISKDSFAGFMDDPMSQHNYLYANANPVNFIDPTGHDTMGDLSAVFSIIGTLAASTGVGAGAGYLTGAALNGASGEDLLNLTDQWVAGFANTVSFGASTKVRSWLYGEVAEQNHSGFMWNMGQVAGTGVAMILGAATPENLTFSMGRDEWLATTYDAIGTGVGAWQTGTHIRQGQLEWSDAFNLLPFAPFAFKGTKQFFGAAMDANETLRSWGRMGVSTKLPTEFDLGFAPGYSLGNANRKMRIAFKDELSQLGVKVEFTTTGNSYFSNKTKTVFLNKKTATPGTLLDEYTHAFNRVHGKGTYLPSDLAELHQSLADQAKVLGSTNRLGEAGNTLYHQLELKNFINSGAEMPGFMRAIPRDELKQFLNTPVNYGEQQIRVGF